MIKFILRGDNTGESVEGALEWKGTGGRHKLRGLQQFKQEVKRKQRWIEERYSRDFDKENKGLILKNDITSF